MNPKAHHIALRVRDLELCEKFYTGILDLQIMKRHQEADGSLRSVWFDLNGVILMLERWQEDVVEDEGYATRANPEGMGWHLLALSISPESRPAWRHKLQRGGVTITGETTYSIYFSDPEDNSLALSHYPEPNPESR